MTEPHPRLTRPSYRGYVLAFAGDLNPYLPRARRYTLPDYQMSQQIIRALRHL